MQVAALYDVHGNLPALEAVPCEAAIRALEAVGREDAVGAAGRLRNPSSRQEMAEFFESLV